MGKETVTRLFNQALGMLRQISVEPCYLGYALSYGLYSIIVSEIYLKKEIFCLELIELICI